MIQWGKDQFSKSDKHSVNFSISLNNPKKYVCEYLTIYCHKGRAHNQQSLVFNSKNQRLAEKLYGGGKSPEGKTMMVQVTGFCFLYILHISLKLSVSTDKLSY